MPITKVTKNQSVVILAKNINPAFFYPNWLIKNNIVNESDILPKSIFTPEMVQLELSQLKIFAVKDQLIFISEEQNTDFGKILSNIIIPSLRCCFDISVSAIGINFICQLMDESMSVSNLSKQLFFKNETPLFGHFNEGNSKFGSYMSKVFLQSRLRLDITPVVISGTTMNPTNEAIEFSYNFHHEMNGNSASLNAVLDILEKWQLYSDEFTKINNLLS